MSTGAPDASGAAAGSGPAAAGSSASGAAAAGSGPAAPSRPPPIEVRGLVKRYGDLTAVAGVDLTVETGDVYGYLGPNGAGKTTSLRMMLGLIRPTEGSVRLFGRDPMESVHALEGVAGFVEAPAFYPYLSARRNLELLAAYDGDGAGDRIGPALETVELTDRAGDRVGGYSHGMRQRLGIAGALLRNPKLLLLDEPATGLDPAGMRDMRLLIRRLADEGMTVLLSSHLLTEVEDICNRVAIVRSGRIVYEGEIAALKRGAGTSYRLETTADERALAVCRAQPGLTDIRVEHGRICFTADEAAVTVLSQALVEAGALIKAMAPQTVTLEDLFFSFTEGVEGEPGAGSRQPAAAVESAR
jgi:ABC-2 type transport system ATP-binding protein